MSIENSIHIPEPVQSENQRVRFVEGVTVMPSTKNTARPAGPTIEQEEAPRFAKSTINTEWQKKVTLAAPYANINNNSYVGPASGGRIAPDPIAPFLHQRTLEQDIAKADKKLANVIKSSRPLTLALPPMKTRELTNNAKSGHSNHFMQPIFKVDPGTFYNTPY